MASLRQDLRYGLRGLITNPGFTAAVVVTLALGIGANTAIFTVVNAVLLRALPYHHPEQLVRITGDLQRLGTHDVGLSVPELFDLQRRTRTLSEVVGVLAVNGNLTGSEEPARVEAQLDSWNYFKMLGVEAALGRVFGPEDAVPGNAPLAVISHGLWTRQFGGDPHVVGRRIRLDNDAYTVIGVLPAGFRHPGPSIERQVDVWVPAGYAAAPWMTPPSRPARFLTGLARLKPGETIATAQADLDALARTLTGDYATAYPASAGWTLRVIPLQQDLTGNVRPALLVLSIVVGVVLLIACVNISNLMLSRANARQGEMAVRLALGASRRDLAQQLLMESLLLAALGGIVGVITARLALEALASVMPADLTRMHPIEMNGAVLAFAAGVSLLTALLCGLIPVFFGVTANAQTALTQPASTRSTNGDARNRAGAILVVAEFAMALTLVIGAILLARSVGNLVNVSSGFTPDRVHTVSVWLPVPNDPATGPYFTPAAKVAFFTRALDRLRQLPGITAVGGVDQLPLAGPRGQFAIRIEGRGDTADARVQTAWGQATPEYFAVMSIPVRRGRAFEELDNLHGQPVAIVNDTFVRRYFPNADPLGAQVQFPPNLPGLPPGTPPWLRIVGVVGDTKDAALEADPTPLLYTPVLQGTVFTLAFVLRSDGNLRDPSGLGPTVARAVRAIDPDLPVYASRPMRELSFRALSNRWFAMLLLLLFAGVAMTLSAIGIYGVMAHAVGQRTREIGVRLALGARPWDVLGLVVKRGLALALMGTGLGLLAAGLLTRMMSSLLYGVTSTDPLTFVAAALLLTLVALLACAVPAWRAARVDPTRALRHQ